MIKVGTTYEENEKINEIPKQRDRSESFKVGTYEENEKINEILKQSFHNKESFIFVARQTFSNEKKDNSYSK